jgi:FkbM family methyltransferase
LHPVRLEAVRRRIRCTERNDTPGAAAVATEAQRQPKSAITSRMQGMGCRLSQGRDGPAQWFKEDDTRRNTMSALVYDIGLHDGRDTSHYLKEGCRVVAFDANPIMCAAAEANFRHYIRTGQLKVINRGVAEDRGQLEFWVCDDAAELSSFHRHLASRNGLRHHAVTVECIPIMDIIDEFGIADYMKIDIEGYDRVCLEGLTHSTAPKYISIELDHFQGDQDIRRLFELGYRNFKVISQNNSWRQVTMENIRYYNQLANRRLVPRCRRRLRRATTICLTGRRIGESGPWGDTTSGSWHSVDHAHSVWWFLHELDERLGTSGGWYDIHAKK